MRALYRYLVLEAKVTGYISRKTVLPGYFDVSETLQSRSPLVRMFDSEPSGLRLLYRAAPAPEGGFSKEWVELLQKFLQLGYNPNEDCRGSTPCTAFITAYAASVLERPVVERKTFPLIWHSASC